MMKLGGNPTRTWSQLLKRTKTQPGLAQALMIVVIRFARICGR